MLLSEFLRNYALQHDLQDNTRLQLEIVVRQFEAFCHAKPLEEITSQEINRWSASLLGRNRRVTVASKVRRIRTLLKAAIRSHLRGKLDGLVRKIKTPAHVVQGFNAAEVRQLLYTAEKIRGWFRLTGIKRSDFFVSYLHGGWDTCFRAGDMLTARKADLRPEKRCLVKVQRKTGRVVVRPLRDVTWDAIERILTQGDQSPERPIWHWLAHREAFYKAFRELCAEAGVRGTSKYLRRARATDEWRRGGPAAAARVLDHADGTGQLAWRNYIDRSQLDDQLPLPPPIG